MPAPKTKGTGVKKGEGKGRKKSREHGDDEEELLAYHREATAKSRNQKSTPKKWDIRYENSASLSMSSPSASRSRSRVSGGSVDTGSRGRRPKSPSGGSATGSMGSRSRSREWVCFLKNRNRPTGSKDEQIHKYTNTQIHKYKMLEYLFFPTITL